jgi:AhpD family alkylhydroperoxidase
MKPRIAYRQAAPEAYQALHGLQKHVFGSGLERRLLDLVYLRVSQINACAYCVDMHAKDLRADGETDQRVDALPVWREAPFYSDRERAALAWAEAVTTLGDDHVGDVLFEATRRIFSEKEIVELTLAVATINAWNRMSIAIRAVPGHYTPAAKT